jgi:hypothetical protein
LTSHSSQPKCCQVLCPLEVGDNRAAGVGEDVGYHEYAAVIEDLVGIRGRRVVRALDQHPCADRAGVGRGDRAAEGGGNQDLALEREQLLRWDRCGTPGVAGVRILDQPAACGQVSLERVRVDADLGVARAARVGDGDQLAPELGDDPSDPVADVSEPLHDHARGGWIEIQLAGGLAVGIDRAAAGGGLSP